MFVQPFELAVKFPGNRQPKTIGTWEECDRLKNRHRRWQISRIESDGRRIVLAQSVSFTDQSVSATMCISAA